MVEKQKPKYEIGQRVRCFQIADVWTNRELLGKMLTIEDYGNYPDTTVFYYCQGEVLHEAELCPAPKFEIGSAVRIVKLLDEITDRDLIGFVGNVSEVDPLPNGCYNYTVGGKYVHEEELEEIENETNA